MGRAPIPGRTLRTRDNHGVPFELYHQMDRLENITQKYDRYHGVKPLRIDHFNLFSPNVDESVAYYQDFGFRTTEYTEDEATGAIWAAWLQRKGGVHDVAFTNGLARGCITSHFWVPTPLDIINLLDFDGDNRIRSKTLSVALVVMASATPSFCISLIRTAIGLRFIAVIIKPLIRIMSLFVGTLKILSVKPCGGAGAQVLV